MKQSSGRVSGGLQRVLEIVTHKKLPLGWSGLGAGGGEGRPGQKVWLRPLRDRSPSGAKDGVEESGDGVEKGRACPPGCSGDDTTVTVTRTSPRSVNLPALLRRSTQGQT